MAKSKLVKANEKIVEKAVNGYKKIENGVVGGYKKIEDSVVGGYKKIEQGAVDGFTKISDSFVDQFLTKEGESVEEAKERMRREKRCAWIKIDEKKLSLRYNRNSKTEGRVPDGNRDDRTE